MKPNAHITWRKKGRSFCDSKKCDAFYGQVHAIVINHLAELGNSFIQSGRYL